MKFTLNDYQFDAVDALLKQLRSARKLWVNDHPKETAVGLAAPTGAGKTVMAAATIEALFFGSEEFDFDADRNATVIWFSDSPNLNEQSRFRLMEASEKLGYNNLVRIEPPFAVHRLDPGKVYFLNTGKLSANSVLVRGFKDSGTVMEGFEQATPDGLEYNLWETIGNTIADPDRTLYFVLDEAHRGFNRRKVGERDTIVQQLLNGQNNGYPAPIVVGISATIDHFTKAMKSEEERGNRLRLDDVVIEPARVQESGLLKDFVSLVIPAESGEFSTAFVTRAATRLREVTRQWKRYATQEGAAEPVKPLLVLQIPNTPDNDEVGGWLDAIFKEIPEMTGASVRHVLGEGGTESFGSWEVDWIEPQRVQQTTEVIVLVAKEAISTGWDCPRAEVLVSARPAQDKTHIAQLLGRMVRSPLARRIPGNESLNTVECILPKFDKTTAGEVVRYITGKIDDLPDGAGPVGMLDAGVFLPNPKIGTKVWESYDALATQSVPRREVKAVKRLISLAQALSEDKLEVGALSTLYGEIHTLLDELATANPKELESAENDIKQVDIEVIKGDVHGRNALSYTLGRLSADGAAIRDSVNDAKRVFGGDVVVGYINHLADDEDGLEDAYIRVAALARMTTVAKVIDEFSVTRATELFARHTPSFAALTDERQQAYEDIRALASMPEMSVIRRADDRVADRQMALEDGTSGSSPLVARHLFADEAGLFPIGDLNLWEQDVVNWAVGRDDVVAWFRNPSHKGSTSFSVAYRGKGGEWRSLQPDFVLFEKDGDSIRPSIADPHATNLEDGLFKLKGLADYAETNGHLFNRIDAIIKKGNKIVALNMNRSDVRDAVRAHQGEVAPLYDLPVAENLN